MIDTQYNFKYAVGYWNKLSDETKKHLLRNASQYENAFRTIMNSDYMKHTSFEDFVLYERSQASGEVCADRIEKALRSGWIEEYGYFSANSMKSECIALVWDAKFSDKNCQIMVDSYYTIRKIYDTPIDVSDASYSDDEFSYFE